MTKKKNKPVLILMMGPTGTARSALADIIKQSHEDCFLVRKSDIRDIMFGNEWTVDKENKVLDEYYSKVSLALEHFKYVIADSTQLTLNDRKDFFSNVSVPKDTYIIAVWIESSINVALKNNESKPKDRQLKESEIRHMYKYMTSPQQFEPFDEMIFLNAEEDMGITSLTSKVISVAETLRNI